MNKKQYETAKGLLDKMLENEWINIRDYFDLESVFEYYLEGDNYNGMRYLFSLETLPRDMGYRILKTIAVIKD